MQVQASQGPQPQPDASGKHRDTKENNYHLQPIVGFDSKQTAQARGNHRRRKTQRGTRAAKQGDHEQEVDPLAAPGVGVPVRITVRVPIRIPINISVSVSVHIPVPVNVSVDVAVSVPVAAAAVG